MVGILGKRPNVQKFSNIIFLISISDSSAFESNAEKGSVRFDSLKLTMAKDNLSSFNENNDRLFNLQLLSDKVTDHQKRVSSGERSVANHSQIFPIDGIPAKRTINVQGQQQIPSLLVRRFRTVIIYRRYI